jgi:hypothetical protein
MIGRSWIKSSLLERSGGKPGNMLLNFSSLNSPAWWLASPLFSYCHAPLLNHQPSVSVRRTALASRYAYLIVGAPSNIGGPVGTEIYGGPIA